MVRGFESHRYLQLYKYIINRHYIMKLSHIKPQWQSVKQDREPEVLDNATVRYPIEKDEFEDILDGHFDLAKLKINRINQDAAGDHFEYSLDGKIVGYFDGEDMRGEYLQPR